MVKNMSKKTTYNDKDYEIINGRKVLTKSAVIREALSWLLIVIVAYVLAYIVTHFLIIKAIVPTGSMKPTIDVNDMLVGNRLSYLFDEPERGDIVIFQYPDNPEENYVKRLIGLPGDTVEMKDGYVYINGSEKPLDEPYLKCKRKGNYGPYEVPEDSYFMLGDNRNNSLDSRFWQNTFVSKDQMIGKVWFRYKPTLDAIK